MNTIKYIFLYFCLCLLLPASVLSKEHLVTRIPDDIDENTIGKFVPDEFNHILGVDIRYSSLVSITEKLGLVGSYSDEAESGVSSICYKYKKYIIEFFESSIGYGYSVTPLTTKFKHIKYCGDLSSRPNLKFNPVLLGKSKAKVIQYLGKKYRASANSISYEYDIEVKQDNPLPGEEWKDVDTNLYFTLKDNKVWSINVSTTETY